MDSFQAIGRLGTASIAAVAPGVAEALLATAAGLFAAIPAVVAYNYFVNRIRSLVGEMEIFSGEFINRVEERVAKIKATL
jgi:biopolymer transport protein TolQ